MLRGNGLAGSNIGGRWWTFILVSVSVVAVLLEDVPAPAPVIADSSAVLPFASSSPTLYSKVSYNLNSPSGTSKVFSSRAGDTILVFFSVFGTNTANVTDSAGDHFQQL